MVPYSDIVFIGFADGHKMFFSQAKPELMRNSLPLRRSVGGGWRWPGADGKPLRGRRHSAMLSQRKGGGLEEGKPCSLHKADILQRL